MTSKAIELVIDYEKKQGRNPKDVSGRYVGYDIESSDRLIEVKARDIKHPFIFLTMNEFENFLKNKNSYLYLVYDLKEKPKLKIFDRDKVLKYSKIGIKWRMTLKKEVFNSTKEINL